MPPRIRSPRERKSPTPQATTQTQAWYGKVTGPPPPAPADGKTPRPQRPAAASAQQAAPTYDPWKSNQAVTEHNQSKRHQRGWPATWPEARSALKRTHPLNRALSKMMSTSLNAARGSLGTPRARNTCPGGPKTRRSEERNPNILQSSRCARAACIAAELDGGLGNQAGKGGSCEHRNGQPKRLRGRKAQAGTRMSASNLPAPTAARQPLGVTVENERRPGTQTNKKHAPPHTLINPTR